MSHDPFDRLRDANPVPGEALPPAPMDTAARIMGKGSIFGRWPAWVVASSAALAVLLVGGGWMLWLGRGDGQTFAADPTTTSSEATTAMPVMETTAYFLEDGPGGPVLVPVPRSVQAGDPVHAALDALLGGPTDEETAQGIWSAFPSEIDGSRIQVVEVDDSSVHLRVADSPAGPELSAEEVAQIVFTLTRVGDISTIRFAIGDAEHNAGIYVETLQLVPFDPYSDHGLVAGQGVRRDFEQFLPPAFVETPSFGAEIELPHLAGGAAYSVGNQVRLTLSDADGRRLWQETVTATCGTRWRECAGEIDRGTWETTIPDVGYDGAATLTAEVFGSGVEILDRRTYPLLVASAGQTTATTTTVIEPGPAVPGELAVYMLMDADATHTSAGPHLVPASWNTAVLSAPLTNPPYQAMQWLLGGPIPGWVEADPPLTSAIPEGTRLLDFMVTGERIAHVDLSGEFLEGDGAMRDRMAQIVFTLTRFEEIDGVRVFVESRGLEIGNMRFGGGDWASRDDFEDLLPPIMIETPLFWSYERDNPLVVSGTANVFEATVSLALTNNDGLILWEGFTTATCGTGCRGDWSVEIPYSVPTHQLGAVIAWEESAQDGSQINVREHPVWLTSDREPEACSGSDVPDNLPDQPDLPKAAAELRLSLFHAARACDWGTLSDLLGPNTNTSFGIVEDPITQWRQEEAAGQKPMWWLAQTLRLPSVQETIELVNGPWMWPSAAAYYWENIPTDDLQALLAVYTQADLDSFADFGAFYGHRVGISPDGEWMFFVAGD